jgi:hypothetical protein
MNIEEFSADIEFSIKAFKQRWIEKNKENPEQYPLEFSEGNSGVWYEMFQYFLSSGEV